MLVSVVMPAYNSETTISESVNSILQQTLTDLELIIVNDASMDNTQTVIERYIKEDSRIRTIQNSVNLGVAKTRNIGISAARGEYIAFIDSDDHWVNNKLERQLELIKRTGAELCYTSYTIVHPWRRDQRYFVPPCIDYRRLLKENIIGCSTVVLKRNILGEEAFSSDYFHEDYVLWLRLLRQGYTAAGVQEPLVYYRKGGRSSDKLSAAKNRWIVYRNAEQLSIAKSSWYLLNYGLRGICKHFIKNPGRTAE